MEAGSGTRVKRPRRGRVLVVDDEVMITRALERLLAVDFDVTTATSGGGALEILASGASFDVILCNVIMPGMGGLTFYEAVRRDHVMHAVRIVFMTGGIRTTETLRLCATVPNLVIEKPFESEELLRLVAARVLVELETEAERDAAAAGDE
jgi:CheY-like chemotaxis protein